MSIRSISRRVPMMVLGLGIASLGCTTAFEDRPIHGTPNAHIVVDTAAPATPYSPMTFGGFLDHFGTQVYGGVFEPGSPLSDGQGFRNDVLAALAELKVPVVRWPGGCYVSGYHWEAGVGRERKPTD